jgi:hypothetical protein
MNIKTIIDEIEKLPSEEKAELYSYVHSKLRKKEYLLSIINEVKGSGKGVWNLDAQEFVNQLRNDRS